MKPEAQLLAVIRTELLDRGRGTEDSPARRIVQYWSLNGELLAEVDPTRPRYICGHCGADMQQARHGDVTMLRCPKYPEQHVVEVRR